MPATLAKPARSPRRAPTARQIAEREEVAYALLRRSIVAMDMMATQLRRGDPAPVIPLDLDWIKRDVKRWREGS